MATQRCLALPLLLCALTLPLHARGEGTPVPAGSYSNQTWTLAGSPYCVQGDITLSAVQIEAGVTVRVEGPYRIDVSTPIQAEGSEEAPILFTALDGQNRWKGLRFSVVAPGSILRHCTIRLASESGLVLSNTEAVVENCTFENNHSNGTGGGVRIYNDFSDARLVDCVIRNNTSFDQHGGGLHFNTATGKSLELIGCLIEGNRADLNIGSFGNLVGGGVRVKGDSYFKNCEFRDNLVKGYQAGVPLGRGGGVYSDNGDAVWENCVFRDNVVEVRSANSQFNSTNAHGGAAYVASGSLLARSCIFSGSELVVTKGTTGGHRGGGLYVNGGSVSLQNCVLARCDEEGLYHAGGSTSIDSSILWANDGAEYVGAVTIDYSCVQGLDLANPPGVGNLPFNPAFAGPGTSCKDLRILKSSPCVDAGNPDPTFEEPCTDIPHGGARADMGAFGGSLACAFDLSFTTDPASVAWRNEGANPDSYVAELPVLGEDWTASIDVASTGHTHALVLGYLSPGSLTLSGGEVLLVAGIELFTSPLLDGPLATWTVPLPNSCAFFDVTIHTQAVHLGGSLSIALSNAQDLSFGS